MTSPTAAPTTSAAASSPSAERTGATIEVLTPDFDGNTAAIDIVLAGEPEVFNHNLETVARLQQYVRRKSQYAVSLAVLAHAKKSSPKVKTKSGLMLGLGETTGEILDTLADLRSVGVDFLTLGQYLQPSGRHLAVDRYLPPEEFDELGRMARSMGFLEVASAPFVRSSYHADEMAACRLRSRDDRPPRTSSPPILVLGGSWPIGPPASPSSLESRRFPGFRSEIGSRRCEAK